MLFYSIAKENKHVFMCSVKHKTIFKNRNCERKIFIYVFHFRQSFYHDE